MSRRGRLTARLAVGVLAAGPLRAEPWKHLAESDGLPSREIQFVKRDGGDVWVGTLGGLVVFRDGAPRTVLAGEAVWDVLPVRTSLVWAATERGIVGLSGTNVDRAAGAFSVGRIVPFGAAGFWAVGKRGDEAQVLEYAEQAWRPLARFASLKIQELAPRRDGTVWAVTADNGAVAAKPGLPPEQWTHVLRGVRVTAVCEDREGRVWCGTWGRGVMVLEAGGTWTRMLEREDGAITAIRQDGKGHLWLATNSHGVWERDGDRWIHHLAEEGTINLLEVTEDGRVFVSSQTVCGLRTWNGTVWAAVLEAPTMFRCVTLGPGGKLWAGNILDGLYREP